jgi:hypothetical protein
MMNIFRLMVLKIFCGSACLFANLVQAEENGRKFLIGDNSDLFQGTRVRTARIQLKREQSAVKGE